MQTLVSGAHLSGVKSATDAPRRVHLRRKPDVKCFFFNTALKDQTRPKPVGFRARREEGSHCSRCCGGSEGVLRLMQKSKAARVLDDVNR